MNKRTKENPDIEAQEQAQVFGLLSENLISAPPDPAMQESLEKRLLSRVQESIAKHAGLLTVRSRDGSWRNLMAGIRFKPLWQSKQGNSVMIEFAPGSALPVHRHTYAEEGIVLSGGLQLDDLELGQFDYHVSPAGSQHGRIRSKQGALAYLRGSALGQTMPMFKELLGGLLPVNHQESETIISTEGGWVEIQAGVSQKVLWSDGIVASSFFRLDPGTSMAGHDHPLDEECMMLSGEIFLGDILLQTGDFHMAPAGSQHLDIFTDTGALLYVRGAVKVD
jgi:quercetin dioxygenase-like cupin family protein